MTDLKQLSEELAEKYSKQALTSYEKLQIQSQSTELEKYQTFQKLAFLAGFDACLAELSKTKVRKKTSEPELSLEAKSFVAKMFPCEPPCDSYGVCSNCCEASVFYAGYNMGFDAAILAANAKNTELQQRVKELSHSTVLAANEVLKERVKELEAKLQEANEVIEFYDKRAALVLAEDMKPEERKNNFANFVARTYLQNKGDERE